MGVWMHGCVDAECVDAECEDVWAFVFMGVWMYGRVDARARGRIGSCACILQIELLSRSSMMGFLPSCVARPLHPPAAHRTGHSARGGHQVPGTCPAAHRWGRDPRQSRRGPGTAGPCALPVSAVLCPRNVKHMGTNKWVPTHGCLRTHAHWCHFFFSCCSLMVVPCRTPRLLSFP